MNGFPIIQKYCPPRYSWYPPKVDSSSPMIFGLCKEFIFVLMCFLVTQFWNTFPNCLLKNTSHEITQKRREKSKCAKNRVFQVSVSNKHTWLVQIVCCTAHCSVLACYASFLHWYKLLFFLNMSINIVLEPKVNYARLCCIAPEKTLRDSCLIILGRINQYK